MEDNLFGIADKDASLLCVFTMWVSVVGASEVLIL